MKGIFWSGVLLFLCTFSSGHPSCPIETIRTELQNPNEIPSQLTFNSAFMSPIVHSFLDSVQPNPFPKGKFMIYVFDKGVFGTNSKCFLGLSNLSATVWLPMGLSVRKQDAVCGTDESDLIF